MVSTSTTDEPEPVLVDLVRWADDGQTWLPVVDLEDWIVNAKPFTSRTVGTPLTSRRERHGRFVVLGARLDRNQEGVSVTFRLTLHRSSPRGDLGGMAIGPDEQIDADEFVFASGSNDEEEDSFEEEEEENDHGGFGSDEDAGSSASEGGFGSGED